MFDRAKFFDLLRNDNMLGPKLTKEEVQGIEALLDATVLSELKASHVAYILATTYHETAGTMQPISEYGTPAYWTHLYDVKGKNPLRARKMGNTQPGDGIKYRGRGFVQLTWKNNYLLAGKKLGIDLVANPDLAMDIDVAARIAVEGMMAGWFTGASLKRLPTGRAATSGEFEKARAIINGTDKATLIADYAVKFQSFLIRAGAAL